jgi:heme exporter protein B
VLWVAALLASLLALESVFRTDLEDGTLEQLVISGQPLALLLMAKTGAHWVVTGLPLVVVAPAVAVSLGVPSEAFGAFVLSLLLGTAVLSLLGAIGAALTLGSRRGSVLMSLLVLPLAIPVLIFGARSTDLAMNDLPPDAGIWLLAALLILGLTLAPFAMAAAVRISLE